MKRVDDKVQYLFYAFVLCLLIGCTTIESIAQKPNFIIIFTDDQGYGDLSCFGGKNVDTPIIDKMADEGAQLTNFYVAAPVCSPSRAALMTGCYPKRIDMATGSDFAVLLAADTKGLHPNEITIAEVLKGAGYNTGMFGKWHLGDQPDFLPCKQGFDEFFGIPYSHDIHPYNTGRTSKKRNYPPLPLLNGSTVIEEEPDANFLVKRVTTKAVDFIEKNQNEPFFLYMPLPLPHKPVHVSPPFMEGVDESIVNKLKEENNSIDYKTRNVLYPQAISEIDWSVGQILATLDRMKLKDNTFVIFASDNGPSIGSAGPLKGRKGTTWEGGMRVPAVAYWPGKIPSGSINNELLSAMDLLPTFANLAKATLPNDRVIDGKDIFSVLTGKEKSPHKAFFYYKQNELQAVRAGKWKLHVDGHKPSMLFNLDTDLGEKNNVLQDHPKLVKNMLKQINDFEKDLDINSRPAAFVDNAKPLTNRR